jgi:hypothetical protein
MKKMDPFQYYSSRLIEKLQYSRKQKDPALSLYKINGRTEAFMLESLCRLFEKGLDDNDFRGWNKLFKKLEDALGQIDFYDVFYKEFRTNKKISPEVKRYIIAKRDKAYNKLEKLLDKKGGLETRTRAFSSFAGKKIKFDKDIIKKIESAIKSEISDINEFVKTSKCNFRYLEEEVHELRRKIRWISMYGQSLGGLITLETNIKKKDWEKKYLTQKIIRTSFNKLPVNDFPSYIHFNKKHFYAISWLISELGGLKDKGLRLEFLIKTIQKTSALDHKAAMKKAEVSLGIKEGEAAILKRASQISNDFFNKHNILNGLIIK